MCHVHFRASHARVVIEWPSGPIQYELNPKGGWTDTMWQNELTSLNMNQGEFELGSHHEGWEGSHYISVGEIDTTKVLVVLWCCYCVLCYAVC